jgi:hypothetical protein
MIKWIIIIIEDYTLTIAKKVIKITTINITHFNKSIIKNKYIT